MSHERRPSSARIGRGGRATCARKPPRTATLCFSNTHTHTHTEKPRRSSARARARARVCRRRSAAAHGQPGRQPRRPASTACPARRRGRHARAPPAARRCLSPPGLRGSGGGGGGTGTRAAGFASASSGPGRPLGATEGSRGPVADEWVHKSVRPT